jgi:hypothetical protein
MNEKSLNGGYDLYSWSFEGCVEEVSCGKCISTFFNMQVVLFFLDMYQMQARGLASPASSFQPLTTIPEFIYNYLIISIEENIFRTGFLSNLDPSHRQPCL